MLVANLIAGGVGLNLTAARQVVFNDLDWVPANHWQAEDRAYRIGQTGTVNVTYVTAAGHAVDEFVAHTLAAKAALVEAVVEGKAIDDAATRDVLSELERMIRELSPRMADTELEELGGDAVEALLREAVERLEAESGGASGAGDSDPAGGSGGDGANANGGQPSESEAMRRAIELLIASLSGLEVRRITVPSNSGRGSYEVVVDGSGDITCSCPGFGYRGTCSHARKVGEGVGGG